MTFKQIRKVKISQRLKAFGLLLYYEALLTNKKRRRRRRLTEDDRCPRCQDEEETLLHTLRD
ncbi:hypothetical protein AHAS_Ahas09G0133300 [Arachis hypogaea]